LLYVAAALREAGHEVRVLDLRARRETLTVHLNAIRNFQPEVVGFSAVVFDAPPLAAAIGELKTHVPHALVAVGGPFAHGSTLECLQTPGVDAAVRGEGEATMTRLVAAWTAGEMQPAIPGVGYPGVVVGGEPEPIADLDALPLPAWDLVDLDLYCQPARRGRIYRDARYLTVLTSRGNPHAGPDDQAIFGRDFRARRPEAVVAEIEELAWKYHIKEVHFVDDGFAADLGRAKQIAERMAARKLEVALTAPAGPRGERIDRELIDKLCAAGCARLTFDIGFVAPRLQALLKRNVNLPKLTMVIDYAARRGLLTHGFFALGLPGETAEEVQETFDFAHGSKLTLATFAHVNALPGTELWDIAARHGKTQDYNPAKIDVDEPIHLAAIPSNILRRSIHKAQRRFYLSPRRLWRLWRSLPRKRQFFNLFLAKRGAPRVREA
jgi:radical SAM superfamily enzyme YgiQ (UPF0313 family)